jgi:hypothetical protein
MDPVRASGGGGGGRGHRVLRQGSLNEFRRGRERDGVLHGGHVGRYTSDEVGERDEKSGECWQKQTPTTRDDLSKVTGYIAHSGLRIWYNTVVEDNLIRST